jgi:aminoglycoside phosphotransferase (APT) family kinase protein
MATVPLPSKRDPEELRRAFTEWFATKVDSPELAPLSIPEGTGMSSETFLVTLTSGPERTSERLVIRMRPALDDFPVFPSYDLELQWKCMELVAERSNVPVPNLRWMELDEGPLGAPFFVMDRLDGEAPTDMPPYVFGGWMIDATPEQRATMQRNAIETLTQLHAIDLSGVDTAFLEIDGYSGSPIDQMLAYQHWFYDWVRDGQSYPIIERSFAYLEAHKPDDLDTVLVWGDARIGNMLWKDWEPVAVLDWEMATIGPREVDLAWMIFLHRFFQNLAEVFGMEGIKGFMSFDEVQTTYTEMSGYAPKQLEWFELFAALRFAIISVRTSLRSISYGQMEPVEDREGLIMLRDLMVQILDQLGG